MKCLRSLSKKLFTFVCSLLGLHFLVSCGEKEDRSNVALYGMPPNYGQIIGTVKGDTDGNGTVEPLANVKIYGDENKPESTKEELVFTTNESGKFVFDLFQTGKYTFRFEDGDGAKNGSFKSQVKTFTHTGKSQYDQDITLERE